MSKTEDRGEDIGDFLNNLVPSLTFCSRMWGTSLGGESDYFLGGQGREVNIVLGSLRNYVG